MVFLDGFNSFKEKINKEDINMVLVFFYQFVVFNKVEVYCQFQKFLSI